MKSKWTFLIVAVIGLGLGAAFAFLQQKMQLKTDGMPAATVISAPEVSAADTTSTAERMAGVAIGGAFSLVDHTGKPVTEKSWPGKYKLVFFGFTHCPAVCPAALQKISALMQSYDPAGDKLAPLFVTVDPARDTPEVMAGYVSHYNPHITGLTGTQEQVDATVEAYKVFAAKIPEADEYQQKADGAELLPPRKDYMVDHSAYVYLMSPEGLLLETFGVEETAEGMIEKLKKHIDPAGAPAPEKNP